MFLPSGLSIKMSQLIREGLDGGGGGSGIHYSFKIKPIIHLIKILGYSLKYDQLFFNCKKGGKEI